ncbi:MAG: hypothetical protein ACKO01_00315 [Erythrobacter sp.]
MTRSPREIREARERTGFLLITAVRFSGVAMIMLGFAIAQKLIDLPWIVGAVLAVAGFFEFFFVPRIIARRFKGEG